MLQPLFRSSFYAYEDNDPQLQRSLVATDDHQVSFINILKKNFFLFSIRGWDNFHIYLWIMKDYAWASQNDSLALIFGVSALSWCSVLAISAIQSRDYEEIYFLIGMFLWLFANFWWMAGETNISGDDDTNSLETCYIMETALAWQALYFLVFHPFRMFKPNPEVQKQFENAGLFPRFKFFRNWRQYEYVHMVCWLCKDYMWNRNQQVLWVICLIPTVLVGLDFMHESYSKNYVVDFAHYTAQLLWVFGNAAWSFGELFYPQYDEPIPVTDPSALAVRTGRWWSCVLLMFAFVPIVLLYFVWVPWVIGHALIERQRKMEKMLDSFSAKKHNEEFNPAFSFSKSSAGSGGVRSSGDRNSGSFSGGREGERRSKEVLAVDDTSYNALMSAVGSTSGSPQRVRNAAGNYVVLRESEDETFTSSTKLGIVPEEATADVEAESEFHK